MRIVHFSDIHFGLWPERFWSALLDKRVLGLVNYFLRRRGRMHRDYLERALSLIETLDPQMVVCTGDVASIGSRREFKAAARALDPLTQNPRRRFVYVPGNHDNYVRSRHCQRAFRETFARLNGGRWQWSDLPLVETVGSLEFMVCDECRPTNIFLSSGFFSNRSAEVFRNWLARPRPAGRRRILIGHYPTRDQAGRPLSWRRRLNGGEIVRRALTEGLLDASLCGHIHDPFCHREDNGAVEVCAGALTVKGKLNVLDLPADGRSAIRQRWLSVDGQLEHESG